MGEERNSRNQTMGNYMNAGEYLFIAIQGQVEPSLWDQTKDDTRFAAIQASKCLIELIILLKDGCTGTISGVWQRLSYITQMEKTVSHTQNPPQGGHTPTGDYKRAVEAHVTTTCRLGGTLAYGLTFNEDILAAPAPGPTTLQA